MMTSKQLTEHDQSLRDKGYKSLGFQNDWGDFSSPPPLDYKTCKKLGHIPHTESTDFGDHTTSCDICKIYFKLDSGD